MAGKRGVDTLMPLCYCKENGCKGDDALAAGQFPLIKDAVATKL